MSSVVRKSGPSHTVQHITHEKYTFVFVTQLVSQQSSLCAHLHMPIQMHINNTQLKMAVHYSFTLSQSTTLASEAGVLNKFTTTVFCCCC